MVIRAGSLALITAVLGAVTGCSESKHVGVTIAPTEAEVAPGGSEAFTGTVTGTSNTSVLWSVAEPAACGVVSQTGFYSAPPDPAICHVVVASAADPQRIATATVTVAAPSSPISISPDPATVPLSGTQQFTVAPSSSVTWSVVQTTATAAPAFPLTVASNGRYLVDRNSRPWRIQADAAWGMASRAQPGRAGQPPGDVDTYLSTRKAQGFNAFYLWPVTHAGAYAEMPNAPKTIAGIAPWTGAPFVTPNEPYWAWIDEIVDKAAAKGMAVMFAFDYLGYPGTEQGWDTEVAARSAADSTTWGTWLGNRYKGKPNIIWFALGDQTPASGSTLEARHLAAINAIKATGAAQPWMAEPMGSNSNPIMDAPAFASALTINSYYGYGPNGNGNTYYQANRAYTNHPDIPVMMQEGGYEFENNANFLATSWETRRTRLWAVLAGSIAGEGFGSRDVYKWVSFPACLSTPGATFSKRAFELFARLPWWDLLPSGSGTGFAGKTLVTSGGGTFGNLDYVASAVTPTGSHLLAYVPTTGGTGARTVTIDMTALSGSADASWWDPATGTTTAIGTFANTGTHSFTSPAANGGGQNDWVLVLDAARTAPCGSISASGLYTAPASQPVAGDCSVKAVLQSDPNVVAYARVILQ